MTDNYGEHQCNECGAPLNVAGLCHRCKALNSCSAYEQLTEVHTCRFAYEHAKPVIYHPIDERVPDLNEWYIDIFGDVVRNKVIKYSRRAKKKIIVIRCVASCPVCKAKGDKQ